MAMIDFRKTAPYLLLSVSLFPLGMGSSLAGPNPTVDQCLHRAQVPKDDLGDHRSFDLGKGNHLLLLDAVSSGVVCLVGRTVEGDKVLDSRTSLLDDTDIGEFGDFSGTGLMKIGGRVFLRTEQFFRGGSNAVRDYYILYGVKHGKIEQVLRLPKHLGLIIYDYQFSETNSISTDKDYLTVHSVLALNKTASDSGATQLYKTSRDFQMKYVAKYSSFLDGTAVCTQDIYLNGGNKPWCHKHESIGYVIDPQFAQNGGGFRLDVVKVGGTKWGAIDDVGLLANISLKPVRGQATDR